MERIVARSYFNGRTPCKQCPLRALPLFENKDAKQVEFIEAFKTGEVTIKEGEAIYLEGIESPNLYTILDGWAFRYRTLSDGRRQILNFLLPGDFLGLQGSVSRAMEHGVEALTDVRLCVFPYEKLYSLYVAHPSLGYDLTWLASREEFVIDGNLITVGRRNSLERIAYLMLHLFERVQELNCLNGENSMELPITQQHFADALGLSLVHVNKTMRRLRETGLVAFDGRSVVVRDLKRLAALARADLPQLRRRPLI
jgi:CRP/FNR family transcriptional regulator